MACNVAFKPIDPKRDEFRRYLERAGVIEALTKIVVRIVKERPANPLEYLKTHLSDAKHQADEYEYMQKELKEARSEIKRLREIIAASHPEALVDEKQEKVKAEKEAKSEVTAGVDTIPEEPTTEEAAEPPHGTEVDEETVEKST